MQVTRITEENQEFFTHIIPEAIIGDDSMIHLGVIADDDEASGAISVSMQGRMANVNWIYTVPSRRREGMASELLGRLILMLMRIHAEGIEVSFPDEFEGIEEFLQDSGFLVAPDTRIYSVPVNDLIYSIMMDRIEERCKRTGRTFPLSQILDKSGLESYLTGKGIDASDLDRISADCSIVRMDENGEVKGCMLIINEPDEEPEAAWFLNEDSIEGLEEMFLTFRDVAEKRELTGENLIFADRNGQIMDYIEMVTDESRELYQRGGSMYGIRILKSA